MVVPRQEGHLPGVGSSRKVLWRFKPDVVLFGYDQVDIERAFGEFVASKGIT
jgi:FAD synthetase